MSNKSKTLDSSSRIRELSRKWFPKFLKKFNKNIINEVYDIASSLNSEVLDILIDTHYFQNILWPNLSEDSSSNHLEIIIYLVLRELEVGKDTLVDTILSDSIKFDKLLNRLLGITESLNLDSNLRTQNYAFLFLSKMMSLKSQHNLVKQTIQDLFGKHITQFLQIKEQEKSTDKTSSDINVKIKENDNESEKAILKLKLRWFNSILKNYMNLILKNKFEEISKLNTEYEENFLDYSSSFLMFLVICSSNFSIRGYVSVLLQELKFTCIFFQDNVHPKLLEYINIVHHYINFDSHIKDNKRFFTFQKIIYTRFGNVKDAQNIALIPSIYDFSKIEFMKFLKGFQKNKLLDLCNNLNLINNVPKEYLSFDFMVEIIIKNYFTRFNMKIDYNNFTNINETEILDDFNSKYISSSSSPFQPQPLPTLDLPKYLSFQDFSDILTFNAFYDYKDAIRTHILQVLDRLKINIDSSMNLNIKGTSKYFANIEIIKKEKNSEILISVNKKDFILNKEELIIVIEIIKPNKFSPYKRIQLYGVNSIKLGLIRDSYNGEKGKKYLIQYFSENESQDQKYEKMNYIIKLPRNFIYSNYLDIITKFFSSKMPPFLSKIFINSEKFDLNMTNTQKSLHLRLNPISLNILKSIYNIENASNSKKRRKLDVETPMGQLSHLLKLKPESMDVEISEIHSKTSASSLDIPQSKALISGLTNFVTRIKIGPHTGYKKYLDALLSCLDLNYSKEKALIILPNYTSLAKIRIPDSIELKSFKYFFENSKNQISNKFQQMDSLLKQVEELSQRLGLSEYGFSHNCENAMVLFKQHIEPKWEAFLKNLKGDKSYIYKYPFESNIDLSGSIEENYEKIIDSYLKIKILFSNLEKLAPLKKLEDKPEEAIQYFITHIANYVFVSSEDLSFNPNLYYQFTSIIYVNYSDSLLIQLLPIMNSDHLKRIILIDNPSINKPQSSLTSRLKNIAENQFEFKTVRNIRSEFFELFKSQFPQLTLEAALSSKFNPGFRFVHQVINIHDKNDHPNVSISEAEYVVVLYQYMLSVGYSPDEIEIIVYSPYQKALLTELISKQFTGPTVPIVNLYYEAASSDMVIQSLFGATLKQIEESFTLPRRGNYMIGRLTKTSWNIPAGKLYICRNEFVSSTKTDRQEKDFIAISDYEHLARFQESALTNR